MYVENTYTVTPFRVNLAFDLVYFYSPDYLCLNNYVEVEEIVYDMKMVIKTMECLKVLISCLYDWAQFTASDAKYFEDCVQSSKEEITMYEFTRE